MFARTRRYCGDGGGGGDVKVNYVYVVDRARDRASVTVGRVHGIAHATRRCSRSILTLTFLLSVIGETGF